MLGCLDLPACASMAAASGRLALKRRMAVSAGDLDLAQTMQAGLAAAAAPAPAAAAAPTAGMYNFGDSAMDQHAAHAQQRLSHSSAGQPRQPATGLMGGDMGLAATTVVAQAQCSASAAQPVSAVAGGGGSIRWQWCDLNLCRPNLAHVC